jgi:hypothetical protein
MSENFVQQLKIILFGATRLNDSLGAVAAPAQRTIDGDTTAIDSSPRRRPGPKVRGH